MSKEVSELNDRSFKEYIIDYDAEEPVYKIQRDSIIEFYMSTCPHCINMAPVYVEASEEFPDVNFYRIDINKYPEVAEVYNVQGTPTFIMLPLKGDAYQAVGEMTLNDFTNILKETF